MYGACTAHPSKPYCRTRRKSTACIWVISAGWSQRPCSIVPSKSMRGQIQDPGAAYTASITCILPSFLSGSRRVYSRGKAKKAVGPNWSHKVAPKNHRPSTHNSCRPIFRSRFRTHRPPISFKSVQFRRSAKNFHRFQRYSTVILPEFCRNSNEILKLY